MVTQQELLTATRAQVVFNLFRVQSFSGGTWQEVEDGGGEASQ